MDVQVIGFDIVVNIKFQQWESFVVPILMPTLYPSFNWTDFLAGKSIACFHILSGLFNCFKCMHFACIWEICVNYLHISCHLHVFMRWLITHYMLLLSVVYIQYHWFPGCGDQRLGFTNGAIFCMLLYFFVYSHECFSQMSALQLVII